MSEREVINCRPLGFAKKLGVAWGVLLVVAGGMWGGATLVANRRLARAEAAWKAIGLSTTPTDYIPAELADSENAAVAWKNAAGKYQVDSPSNTSEWFDERFVPYSPMWWVTAWQSSILNRAMIEDAVAAGKMSKVSWGTDPTNSATFFARWLPVNSMVRTLKDETRRRYFSGDQVGMWEMLETQERLARSMLSEPLMLPRLVAGGIESQRVGDVPQMAAGLRIGEGQDEVSRERVQGMVSRLMDTAFADWRRVWGGEFVAVETTAKSAVPKMVLLKPIAMAMRAQSVESITRAASTRGDEPEPRLAGEMPMRTGPFQMGWEAARTTESVRRIEANRGIAAMSLIVALFRADHGGRWPESQMELQGWWKGPLPRDPYRASGPFEYLRFGPKRRPIVRGVGSSGTMPEGPPKPSPYIGPGPEYSLSAGGKGQSEVYVWVDLSTYTRGSWAAEMNAGGK